MRQRTFLLAFLLGASILPAQEAAPPPASQKPLPTFPGQVEQVTVDVVVADKKGVPLKGFTKEAFEIFEDGVRQTVVSFEAVDVPAVASAVPKPPPKVSTNQVRDGAQGRTFVILFDDIRLTPAMAQQAKAAVGDFLTHSVREGDRVTLVATLAGTWWTTRMAAGRDELIGLVKRLDGRYIPDSSRERMTDLEAKRIHMDRDIEVAQRVQRRYAELGVAQQQTPEPQQSRYFATSINPYVESKAAEVYSQCRVRSRTTLTVLERSLEALNATKGRKSVLLISAGFIWDSNLDEFKSVARAARRANTAVYFVDAEGLEGMPFQMTAEFGAALPEIDLGFALSEDFWDAEGAEAIASDSGGFTVHNTNDLSAGFKRVADENSSYYLLGYNPSNTARDGAFRKISVKVPGRRDTEIRARKGYYAPSDGDASRRRPGKDSVFQEALDSPYEIGDIPLRMTHFVGDETMLGKARVEVVAEVDLRALDLEPREGRYLGGVEFLLVTAHRETGEFFRYDQKVEMKLLPATQERLRKTWVPIRRGFELQSGGYQAKIVVRDKRSGRVGTVVHRFEVPELGAFRVSTPVLSDNRREAGESVEEEVLPVARRVFEQGAELLCRFEVFGAQKDGSGMPRVDMGYVVRRVDGSVLKGVAPAEIRPTSLGKLSRLFHFGLQAAEPGEYELVMVFYDHLSGKSLELKEPFSVQAEGALEQASNRPGG
jgi:VWFA-related protein